MHVMRSLWLGDRYLVSTNVLVLPRGGKHQATWLAIRVTNPKVIPEPDWPEGAATDRGLQLAKRVFERENLLAVQRAAACGTPV